MRVPFKIQNRNKILSFKYRLHFRDNGELLIICRLSYNEIAPVEYAKELVRYQKSYLKKED